jgi:hypothetical protein
MNVAQKANVMIQILKEQPGGTDIITRYESASKMRNWIIMRRSERAEKHKTLITDKIRAEKMKKINEEQAKDDTKTDEEKAAELEEKMKLTADEKMDIEDQAYDKAVENMQDAYKKIIVKAEFLIKLCNPVRFKKR